MPYARTGSMRRTYVRRTASPGFRGGKRLIWTYETVSLSPAGTVPNNQELANALIVQLAINDRRGITWLGCHLDLTAVPLAAPAAGTRDTLVAALVKAPLGSTTAQTDPSTIATRANLDIAWLHTWPQPYIAAPVGATQTIESHYECKVKAKRLLRSANETILLALGSQNAAQSWHVDGLISSLWLVR